MFSPQDRPTQCELFTMSSLAALAAALPRCAVACVLTAVEDSVCAITNQTCVCHDEDLNAKATACVTMNCTIREALFTKDLTYTSCGIAPGVDHSYMPITISFTALSAVAILLRVVARIQARVPVWWDDFIISLSFLGCLAYGAVIWASRSHGLGTDIWAVPFDDITLISKALYAQSVLYTTSCSLVRQSVLLFYYRIFGRIPLARRLIQATFVLSVSCCIAFDLVNLFGCTPFEYYWTSWDGQHEGHCINENGNLWTGAFVAIVIDIGILLIPLPFIARLNLPLRKRVLSSFMFAFGIFVIAVSFYRLTTINRFTLSQNPTADSVDVAIWTGLELYVSVICACLPNVNYLLKPVYAWLSRLSSSTSSASIKSSQMSFDLIDALSSRERPSSPTGSRSGNNSGYHGYPYNTKSSLEPMIRMTTMVDVEQLRSESQEYLNNPGWGNTIGSVEMDLGSRNWGETRGSRWA
ncbi:hypothetical protein F4677DRAFT_400427 [Hypoxylon crocopeplum]|nr:hypothetical protein F4677DRAFT_400427 [Hypoxylon crocopeplum]